MSTGFSRPACGGRKRAQRCPRRPPRARAARGRCASQASASRMPGPPALVTTPTRRPGRQRLRGEQRGDVEELLERVGADDAGLLEQRVDGHVDGSRAPPSGSTRRASPPRERPDFTATIGFRRATSGATRANLRGLPKLSR